MSERKDAVFAIQKRVAGIHPSITITTRDPDRENDRIDPAGIDTSGYMKAGAPVLYGHDYGELPIGRTLSITPEVGGLRAEFAWLENDERSARVKNAWDQGALGGASIGFLIKRAVRNELGGRDIKESDLIEWSLTPVPCNAGAVKTLRSLGLWRAGDEEIELPSIPSPQHAMQRHYGRDPEITIPGWSHRQVSEAIRSAITSSIRDVLGAAMVEGVSKAILRARGRVD